MADLIIICILCGIISLTVYRYVKSKKSGQSGCAGCSYSTSCGETPSSCHSNTTKANISEK